MNTVSNTIHTSVTYE